MKKDKKKKELKKSNLPEFKTEEEKYEYLQKQMEDILKELKETDSELSIGLIKKMKRRRFLIFILDYLFIIGLIFGLSGYISWANFDSIWSTLIFSLITIGLDILLTFITYFFLSKLILLTLGLITILTLPLSLIGAIFIYPKVEIISINATILFVFLLLIVRSIVKVLLASKKILLKVKR